MCVGGYMVAQILRLSHKVGPNPAHQDVRAVRCFEMVAPRGANRNVHLANCPSSLLPKLYTGYCAALKIIKHHWIILIVWPNSENVNR
jgi:hypothetical protein